MEPHAASGPAEIRCLLRTGLERCFDVSGREVACAGSGQDGETARGVPWPEPRFERMGDEVLDRLTGLSWLRDASAAVYPLSWQESLEYVGELNREAHAGRSDWRLPDRRELRSLVDHGAARPALPSGNHFINVVQAWYWSSTTAAVNPAYAWYVNMEGGRMFYGEKEQYFLLWPVRGGNSGVLPATGQSRCYDTLGREIACAGTGQDAETARGVPWPEPRFELRAADVLDRLTGLAWRRSADLAGGTISWPEALDAVAALNRDGSAATWWRLPNINELESLVDCAAADPALPPDHMFTDVRDTYWSSTSSVYESDWAWALYLGKGACGVGRKEGSYFHAWAVRDGR